MMYAVKQRRMTEYPRHGRVTHYSRARRQCVHACEPSSPRYCDCRRQHAPIACCCPSRGQRTAPSTQSTHHTSANRSHPPAPGDNETPTSDYRDTPRTLCSLLRSALGRKVNTALGAVAVWWCAAPATFALGGGDPADADDRVDVSVSHNCVRPVVRTVGRANALRPILHWLMTYRLYAHSSSAVYIQFKSRSAHNLWPPLPSHMHPIRAIFTSLVNITSFQRPISISVPPRSPWDWGSRTHARTHPFTFPQRRHANDTLCAMSSLNSFACALACTHACTRTSSPPFWMGGWHALAMLSHFMRSCRARLGREQCAQGAKPRHARVGGGISPELSTTIRSCWCVRVCALSCCSSPALGGN